MFEVNKQKTDCEKTAQSTKFGPSYLGQEMSNVFHVITGCERISRYSNIQP